MRETGSARRTEPLVPLALRSDASWNWPALRSRSRVEPGTVPPTAPGPSTRRLFGEVPAGFVADRAPDRRCLPATWKVLLETCVFGLAT